MQQRASRRPGHEPPSTNGAIVTLGDDGIVDIDFRHCGRITLAISQAVHAQHRALCPDRKSPVLLRDNHVGAIDYDVQRFASSPSVVGVCSAMGLVGYSFLERHLARLFVTYHRPPYPTRVFDNEADARAWLHNFRDEG